MTPILLLAALAGPCLGSFAATAALRATRAESAIHGRSRCDCCGRSLSFSETIPIMSAVKLKGACSGCGAPIDPLHLLGEIGGGLIAITAVVAAPPARASILIILGLILLASAIYDAKTRRLPDRWTIALLLLSVGLSLMASIGALITGLTAAAVSVGVLMIVRWSFRRLTSRQALGLGDVKLIGALAIWLGASTPMAIAVGSALGLIMVAARKPRDGLIAFGPAIACGAWIVGCLKEGGAWPI